MPKESPFIWPFIEKTKQNKTTPYIKQTYEPGSTENMKNCNPND